MERKNNLVFRDLINSFIVAFKGLWIMIASQRHAWIHLIATVIVVTAGFKAGVTRTEWCWLIIACVSVWTSEALNTALEFLCDVASPEFHPLVEKAKDVAAAAVLICAIGAAIIGLIILGPYFFSINTKGAGEL